MTFSTGNGLGARQGYLDWASSEPLHPAARETLLAALDVGFADPLRLHNSARSSRLLLENARAVVASALGVREDEVSFTASGTQAVHLGLLGLLQGRARVSRRVVHTAVEHSSVFQAASWWSSLHGGTTETVGVDDQGRVFVSQLSDLVAEPTGVVAVQSANHEVGTLQPLPEVYDVAAAADVPVFVDFAASAGRLDLPPGWAAAAASAHKWGGPPGVGVLLVRKGARWRAPFPVDDRADPRVSGFENVPGALAAAAALQARVAERAELDARLFELVARVRDRVVATIEDVEVVGAPDGRLPHLVTFSCLYVDGEALVTELDRRGFAVASGSSCTASTMTPSHVLAAMGALTHGNVRLSLGRDTTADEVDAFLAALPEVVASLRP